VLSVGLHDFRAHLQQGVSNADEMDITMPMTPLHLTANGTLVSTT
jgi:hypothetical protein